MLGILRKLLWAGRVLRTKNFVILTDTSSVVSLDMKDPETVENKYILTSQRNVLSIFIDKLKKLIKEHEQEVELLKYKNK